MEHRRIGSLEASVIGLGCNNFGWRLDADATAAVVHAALDAGIDFFDTAELYGEGLSEQYLGRALRGHRERVVIATKFGYKTAAPHRRGHPDNVRRAADASLQRLGTDYIDLFRPTRTSRSRRRSARSTNWSSRVRCARSAARTSRRRNWTRQRTR